MDERSLVASFLSRRKEDDFRKLYRMHTECLFRLAVRLNDGNRDIAEDIVQEAWMRAVQGLPQFRWQSALRTWLCSIVINCCRDHYRKNKTVKDAPEDIEHLLQHTDPAPYRGDLQKALNVLPVGYREVLVLHDLEGYKHEEIGELLGINEGTSRSQLHHARRAMRKLMS
jgi:RNA polymerase sigma-70 factor (ECF subfamily)